MSKTEKNLQDAFSGESQANRKYLAFAKKAEGDGYKQVAKLFRAAAEAETVHALNHFSELGGIKGTKENLEAAISGETNKNQKMYPQMIKDVQKDWVINEDDCVSRKPERRWQYRTSPERGDKRYRGFRVQSPPV